MAHILVVDDDGDLRALLKTALERDGHQVSLLDRGGAVSEAHCRWADCILLDVMMPGEDGFATCRRIRALAAHLRTHKDYDIIHYHTASKIGAPVCGIVEPPLCYISVNLAGKKAAQLGYAWQLLPVQGIFVPLVKE